MLIVYSFTRVAVTVRRWFEVRRDAGMETGVRIELSLVTPQPHQGSASAAQPVVVDGTFWRADIFGLLDQPAASFSAAHFHPCFQGGEPSPRTWSTELTEDPWGWLEDRLSCIEQTMKDAGVDPNLARDDAEDIRLFVPQIVATARNFGPDAPMSRDENFRLTRDATERVRMLAALVEDRTKLDEPYLEPWLERRTDSPR